jgi:Tol biopolymer transport system component
VLLGFLAAACGVIIGTPPANFPQFAEQAVTGLGEYLLPQWSPDGRYLAFIDASAGNNELVVYDTTKDRHWVVASRVSPTHFDWDPNGRLTYLNYKPELSGSPFPSITELRGVDLDGRNDEVLASNLHSAGNFAWFRDGQRLVILLSAAGNPKTFCKDAYLLDIATATSTLLVTASELDTTCISMLALSPDETRLLIYGIRESNAGAEAKLLVYDLVTRAVTQTIVPSQVIPAGSVSYPTPGIGDDSNFGWVGGNRWILALANTPAGECYNYSLFFFDLENLADSFCIPTAVGVASEPTISPDLTRIAYVSILGPGSSYVMIGELTQELRQRLGVADSH